MNLYHIVINLIKIDIHALLEKNPLTKKLLLSKFGYKYFGSYNDLENQLSYNKKVDKFINILINQKIIYIKLLVDMTLVIL